MWIVIDWRVICSIVIQVSATNKRYLCIKFFMSRSSNIQEIWNNRTLLKRMHWNINDKLNYISKSL